MEWEEKMLLNKVEIQDFAIKVYDQWVNKWFVLTCGDYNEGEYNSMIVAWGSFGVMWKKPFVQVVVRPTRYTYEFMESYDTFTLCGFSSNYRKAMQILGTRSGRDGDKITASGLTPIASQMVAAPSYKEAKLIIECKKIYSDNLNPANFIDPDIDKCYPAQDYHKVYFGEILAVFK